MPRFYCPTSLATGDVLELPAGAARHVQVLRLQPGDGITLFNGMADAPQRGGEFAASVLRMARSSVTVQVGAHNPVEREAASAVHLVVGMPANERMDWLVEKATELGVASIQPLMTERSVLRLNSERAEKKTAHWQSIAIAACEQCGRNRVPVVHAVMGFTQWAKTLANTQSQSQSQLQPALHHYLLSLRAESQPLHQAMVVRAPGAVTFLSGPEGGLAEGEEDAALRSGFVAVSLGARVLRAETAALAALTLLA